MEALKKNYKKIISLKKAKNLVVVLIIAFLFDFFFFAMPILADEIKEMVNISGNATSSPLMSDKIDKKIVSEKVKRVNYHTVTAYNSDYAQTDDSPCVTANGFNLCEHGKEDSVAANFLPFGAKVRMPELFGNRVFTVRDRMNARHKNRIDIWMIEKHDAKNFGVKLAKIEILE